MAYAKYRMKHNHAIELCTKSRAIGMNYLFVSQSMLIGYGTCLCNWKWYTCLFYALKSTLFGSKRKMVACKKLRGGPNRIEQKRLLHNIAPILVLRERQSLAYTECLLKPLKDTVRAQPGVQAGTMGRLHMLDFEDAICL